MLFLGLFVGKVWCVQPGITLIKSVKVVSATAPGGAVQNPEALFDGNPATAMTYPWANGGVSVVVDMGTPYAVSSITITNGAKDKVFWLSELSVGSTPDALEKSTDVFVGSNLMTTWRPLLGRQINLTMWAPNSETSAALPEAVGRYLKIEFRAGGPTGEIAEVKIFGRPNIPERHLMCWSGDIKNDYLDKMDYFSEKLGATDLWLDYIEGAFPQSNNNAGFKLFEEKGVLKQLAARGIRYWLSEHEAFTMMVNNPSDLRDDLKWQTTFEQARSIYSKAKKLGFRGLVYDAEDYEGVSGEAAEKYKSIGEPVDAWCFSEEFGISGMYYQRGLQMGKIIKESFGGPLLQVYEARLYAASNDRRAGNYWWLKGIHDGGTEVWLATERTYGAGNNEITENVSHLGKWFVDMRTYVNAVQQSYPFVYRVLPGFHPWNTRTKQPCYLPKYLDEQLIIASEVAPAYWIYNEGNSSAGDPRVVLDKAFLTKYNLTAEDYLNVFKKNKKVEIPKPEPIIPIDR